MKKRCEVYDWAVGFVLPLALYTAVGLPYLVASEVRRRVHEATRENRE